MIYANLKTIERLDLETNVTETVASRTSSAVDLDIHYEKGFVYWSDVHEKKISRYVCTTIQKQVLRHFVAVCYEFTNIKCYKSLKNLN